MRTGFRKRIREAIANPVLQRALDQNAERRLQAKESAYASIPNVEDLRQHFREVREKTVNNLDTYLAQLRENLQAHGIHVHWAESAERACQIVLHIAYDHNASLIAKSKSMISEEIALNHALEKAGLQVVETDLGEYIVQLRGEPPAHIITPAVHLLREDVGETFARELGMPYTTDIEVMTETAREKLREVFLSADIGISGVNCAVAESGTLCLVTNEGNGRMVTTLPPVHIALLGLERIVPTLPDLVSFLQLLPPAATGQSITSYISLIQAPRGTKDPDGPSERHVILLDNGRHAMADSPLAESLLCIRCGACLNACPVFQEIGGHAYGSVYPGPIGSVISPGLFGVKAYGHLAKASTLCGACQEVCPVMIDLPTMLLRVRKAYVTQGASKPMRWGMRAFAWLMAHPRRYRWAKTLASWFSLVMPREDGWIRMLPPPFAAWTATRRFPRFAPRSFLTKTKTRPVPDSERKQGFEEAMPTPAQPYAVADEDLTARFKRELEELGGEFFACEKNHAPECIAAALHDLGVHSVMTWDAHEPLVGSVLPHLTNEGFQMVSPELPFGRDPQRTSHMALDSLQHVEAGLTGAVAGLAHTGTVVIPGGWGRSQLASLLPPVHLAVIAADTIHATMNNWLAESGERLLREAPQVSLISGPSRTADIEMTLTTGVHGPKRLLVFCLH
jgi:L-lactate dehydrogenase complex protein LldF